MSKWSKIWNALTRKKQVDANETTKLARVLNLFDLTALGVSSTLGLGVYVLAGSVAYEQAGPAVVISFLLAAFASAFAGLCYCEFAARVPRAGSAYIYSYVTVGEFVAFTIGWNLLLEYVIGASSVARGLSGYIDALTGNKMGNYWLQVMPMHVNFLAEYADILSFSIVTLLTIILAAGVKESSYVHSAFTVINMLTILLVVVAGSIKANPANWSIVKEDIPENIEAGEGGFMPFGIAGVLAGAAKCFYGFVGFDCVATAGEEAKNAKRNIPLAMILTLAICVAVYIAISTILTMVWPYYLQNPEAPFPHIFEQIGWIEIKWTVSIGAVFALCTSLLGAMYSLPRVLYAMASDGVLFRFMSRVHQKTKTPVIATLISGIFSAVMAAVFSLHQLVDMLSIGTLLAYTIVAICVLILRYEHIDVDENTLPMRGVKWREIFSFRSSKNPTRSSSTITKLLVVLFSILSTVLGCLISFLDFTVFNIVGVSVVGVAMIAIVFLIFLQPVDNKLIISFKVPFVPLLPCFSIFCNIFLMLQLDGATWIRFGVWMIIDARKEIQQQATNNPKNKKNHICIEACKISEFACRGGSICLPLDKYCDGRDDCGDSSDEPKFCTVCNRTYYGDIGRTYSLRVPPPQWNRLPFLCHITFTASGHEQGDIVQIIFDAFSVGRFDEGLIDSESDSSDTSLSSMGDLPGCPEGFMQLSELGRPFTGGSWCGAATGPQLYYSETSTVTASVKVFHAPMQAATPFEFRIRYKFISQSDAIVRYGAPNELLELGKVTPGTYCTRQFDECYRKKCRLQSPNYPGMYPRNVTCYWTIRQKTVPTCKHAMVSVSQENAHKALVKRSIASLNKTFRSIRAWSDCTGERDHLIFYDGSSTNDPVLAKYCGGDWLPKVVSRGPEMLVAFHSSPFSAPLQSNIPNRGFELDVDLFFVDSDSHDYAQGTKGICEFNINASNTDDVLFSRRGRMGKILSPRHTLPPNTTCTYYFHGQPGDLIWISFTSYNLQILQHAIQDNNTLGRNDLPPWITRLRIWDSVGSSISSIKTTAPISATTPSNRHSNINNMNNTVTTSNYYYSPQNPIYGKNIKVNIDNVWNPVDSYIYGPTQNSIFNQPNNKFGGSAMASQKFEKFSNGIAGGGSDGVKDTYNYVTNNVKDVKTTSVGSGTGNRKDGGGGSGGYRDGMTTSTTTNSIDGGSRGIGTSKPSKHSTSRKLIAEHYDNETPRLCDHSLLENSANRMRPCSPLESYVSTSKDMKIEFHSHTGTALYPASFSLNYEFVDTDLGGENWLGRRGEDPVPALCSRIFRKRRGNFQSPRNVFLHGRGGAKNISCLYRFEAGIGERVRLVLHNVSFGDAATCNTETDLHTGRPKCTPSDIETDNVRQGELKILDVPYRDVKITLGCFCDNTSSLYSTPLAVQSYSRTMELMFTVTNLNISEDFADVYFHASYEYIRVPDCPKRMRLRGSGGEEDASFPLRSKDASCEGLPWYIEAQQNDRSLFVLTWGSFLPMEPTVEDSLRCITRNRLIVYSGKPLKIVRIICPGLPEPRQTALHIFSEDWISQHPTLFAARPVNMVVEPIFRDPGNIGFQWMEIQRTRASQIQQLEMHTNFSLNDTLNEFGFIPRDTECEYKCPELDACIAANLWCDGRSNCPSGYDESEEECGTARKLLELPGGLFAAMGCMAAAMAACLIFCIFGLVRKKRKTIATKALGNGSCNGTLKKDPLFIDPGS